MQKKAPKYRRVLLKLSGEALVDEGQFGINHDILASIVTEVCVARALGTEFAIVVGGGNMFRGASLSETGMDRATADYVGMLATVINAMILQEMFRRRGLLARAMSALHIDAVVEPYIRGKAIRYLDGGTTLIFAAGTGNPFFTTDTAAALRAAEIGANILLKATKVDGVYSCDPMCYEDATFYREISFLDALKQGVQVMDGTALSLCSDQQMPVIVFNMLRSGALTRIINGQEEGTLMHC